MNTKMQKPLVWAVIISESSHIFCCVLPTLLSLAGLLAGLGMIVSLPPFMIEWHERLHEWELPMIILSGVILGLGWAAITYGNRIDCHGTGCSHGECAPRKNRAHLVLKAATILFIVNVSVYFLIHRTNVVEPPHPSGHTHIENHDHP